MPTLILTTRFLIVWMTSAVAFSAAQDRNPVEGFTRSPTEHIINEVDQPFVVQQVKGIVTCPPRSGDPLPNALFEIRGPGDNRTIRHAVTDEKGRFRIRHVPWGQYRFKATYNGNQSVVGTIIVCGRAQERDEIRIEMRVGV